MHYFAYGSNMSLKRIRFRIPSALPIAMAVLYQHRLKFHKVGSRDGSAKCDVEETGHQQHAVMGVLYDIPPAAKQILDRIEGLGSGYEEKTVSLELPGGIVKQAFTYFATHIDPSLKTFHWYKEHVIRGARENGLPAGYIHMIESIESVADPDVRRQAEELSIYEEVACTG